MGLELLQVIRAEDISVSGISFQSEHAFSAAELTQEVELVITLPGRKCFLSKATVRNVTGAGRGARFGLQFVGLSESHGELISNYVARLAAEGRGK